MSSSLFMPAKISVQALPVYVIISSTSVPRLDSNAMPLSGMF